MQCGFVESEPSALFSANNRTEMNFAAHEVEVDAMVAGGLHSLFTHSRFSLLFFSVDRIINLSIFFRYF